MEGDPQNPDGLIAPTSPHECENLVEMDDSSHSLMGGYEALLGDEPCELPNLGTEGFLNMTDQEFYAMLESHNSAGAQFSDLNSQASIDPALQAPNFNQYINPDEVVVPQSSPIEFPSCPFSDSLPGFDIPLEQGVAGPENMPLTEVDEIDLQARAMVNTMAHIRVQTQVTWNLLRRQHNSSLGFFMEARKKPTGKREWSRYLNEMHLGYNMLRDYQMQAYKSVCGCLKVWIRYYDSLLKPDTVQGCILEFREYARIQSEVSMYRFPEWHAHPALDQNNGNHGGDLTVKS